MKKKTKETEPGYMSLAELKRSKKIPENIKDLIYDRHVRQRNEIKMILGEIELAYRRGFAAGEEAERKRAGS